jgi:hypothetical protein
MTNESLLEWLRQILAQNAGIFPVTQEQLNIKNLETLLLEESLRTTTSFAVDRIKIADLRRNIALFQTENLPGNKKISHLAFIYGLETKAGRNNIKLVMFGAKLDDSPTADLTVKLSPGQITVAQFSNNDLMPSDDPGRIMEHDNLRKHFVDSFMPLFDNKIVHGAYIRVDDFFIAGQKISNLSAMLDKLELEEYCDELNISFGFMKAITADDWNCFHLIFRGQNTVNNILSRSIFSTYEFSEEHGYTGPRPGCPPFSCNLFGKSNR